MMRSPLLGVALLAVVSVALGCAPEPLEGFSQTDMGIVSSNNGGGPDGGGNNGAAEMGGGGNNGTTGENWHPDFEGVAEIFFNTCTEAGCHGDPPGGRFWVVPIEDMATLQASLESTDITNSGSRLVTAGDKDSSAIYIRITGAQGTTIMPTGNPLPQTEIDQIGAWIDAGAPFTQ